MQLEPINHVWLREMVVLAENSEFFRRRATRESFAPDLRLGSGRPTAPWRVNMHLYNFRAMIAGYDQHG